jgi:hypothetical protein
MYSPKHLHLKILCGMATFIVMNVFYPADFFHTPLPSLQL